MKKKGMWIAARVAALVGAFLVFLRCGGSISYVALFVGLPGPRKGRLMGL